MANKIEQEVMIDCIVARGCTVCTPHPSEKVIVSRPDPETGRYTTLEVPALVHNAPGKKLSLPKSDHVRLMESGFLIDPSDEVAITGLKKSGYLVH